MPIIDRLQRKPALDSFFLMHADFSGTITENFLLTIRTSWRDADPGYSDSL